MQPKIKFAARAALIGVTILMGVSAATADIRDYEFQLVQPTVKVGPQAEVTVRLTNKTTGKPVADAVIFATRIDMAPEGMADMTPKITALPGTEPGVYKFKTNLSMAGRWQLSLGAKVQGESGTVEGRLIVKAEK